MDVSSTNFPDADKIGGRSVAFEFNDILGDNLELRSSCLHAFGSVAAVPLTDRPVVEANYLLFFFLLFEVVNTVIVVLKTNSQTVHVSFAVVLVSLQYQRTINDDAVNIARSEGKNRPVCARGISLLYPRCLDSGTWPPTDKGKFL